MDYARYIELGYQIGSGAMESLHRVASQLRIKRPGPGWLPETAQAVFNLRMLALVGRWDEFWNQPSPQTASLLHSKPIPIEVRSDRVMDHTLSVA